MLKKERRICKLSVNIMFDDERQVVLSISERRIKGPLGREEA